MLFHLRVQLLKYFDNVYEIVGHLIDEDLDIDFFF